MHDVDAVVRAEVTLQARPLGDFFYVRDRETAAWQMAVHLGGEMNRPNTERKYVALMRQAVATLTRQAPALRGNTADLFVVDDPGARP